MSGGVDLVGDLLEDHGLGAQPLGRDGAALGIDHALAGEAVAGRGECGEASGVSTLPAAARATPWAAGEKRR